MPRTGVQGAQCAAGASDHRAVTVPPFQFRLERVRSLRERAEEQAKEQLAAGLAHRLRGEALLHRATTVVHEAHAQARDTALSGATAADLRAAQLWLERAERERQAAALDLDRRDAEVDARRTVLARAAQDHEVIVRLEGRRRAEHAREHGRREQADLDEVALAQFRRTGTAA
jgi:flagellar FliJ protein